MFVNATSGEPGGRRARGGRAARCGAADGALAAQALTAFRDARASFLLATPAAARGLDLPAVSHVYSLAPPASPADYLHRAGRAGRIGARSPGARPPCARRIL